MAITKIRPITATLKKAIDYIRNSEKTDGKLLVSSFACAPETADVEFEMTRSLAYSRGDDEVLARHLVQAFAPGELTPQQAHEIGVQFANEVLGGKYEYVIATHIDKGHIHNHIIFNNVDIINHRRYRSNLYTYHRIQQISDKLCRENELSVIKEPIPKNHTYKEWEQRKQGTSWKAKLQNDVDACIISSKDFSDFLKNMQAIGYEVKQGKYIAFRAPKQEKFTRAKAIGNAYTEEAIKERISEAYAQSEQGQEDTDYQSTKPGNSWKEKLQDTIDKVLAISKDFPDFLKKMESAGYEVKQGKHIAFRASGQDRFTRSRSIGEDYTEDAIRARISGTYSQSEEDIQRNSGNRQEREETNSQNTNQSDTYSSDQSESNNNGQKENQNQRPKKNRNTVYRTSILKVNLLVNIQARAVAKGRGYEQWMQVRNLKEIANTINFLTAQDVQHYEQLSGKIDKLEKDFASTGAQIKEAEAKIRDMSELISAVSKYQKLRPISEQYKKAWNKKKFYTEHESELIIFEAAKHELKERGITIIPNLTQLRKDYQTFVDKKIDLYMSYRDFRERLHNFKNAKTNVDKILHHGIRKGENTKQREPEKT